MTASATGLNPGAIGPDGQRQAKSGHAPIKAARRLRGVQTSRGDRGIFGRLMDTHGLALIAAGLPAHGNQRSAWDAGCRFDYPNPEYR